MSFESYRGKSVTIKSTEQQGTVEDLLRKRGAGGVLSVRFLVVDLNGKKYELMPHELKLN